MSSQKKASTVVKGRSGESHINFWVPDVLMEKIKIHSAKTKKSVKQIGIEALKAYIEAQNIDI